MMVLFRDAHLFIEYEPAFDFLFTESKGQLSSDQYRQHLNRIVEVLVEKKVRFWLNNAAHATIIFPEDQSWSQQLLESRFTEFKLEKLALVLPQDLYNQMALESILQNLGHQSDFQIQYFTHESDAREWLEESFREVCFFDEGLDIEYDGFHHWIYANWKGNHNFASVKRGCELIMDLLEAKSCRKLLNDNRHALGNWMDASDWVIHNWVPRLQQKGIEATAWILSPSGLHRNTAHEVFSAIQSQTPVQIFTDLHSAKSWLQHTPRP